MTAEDTPTVEVAVTANDGSAGPDAHRARYDGDVQASVAVVEQVAELTGTDPTELTPLGTVLDSDALDHLVRAAMQDGERGAVSLSFTYEGHAVTVHDG